MMNIELWLEIYSLQYYRLLSYLLYSIVQFDELFLLDFIVSFDVFLDFVFFVKDAIFRFHDVHLHHSA